MLTEAQLKMRKSGLGGSDIAAALGLSPWKTQIQLWAEKSGKTDGQPQSAAMEWGSRLEAAIFAKFKENNPHLKLSYAAGTVRSDEHKFLLATPDGFIVDELKQNGLLEVKTSSQQVWDEVPIYYILQVQQYMYVTGRSFAYFAVLFRGTEYREYGPITMDRDAYEKHVLPELAKFWDCVESGKPLFEPQSMEDLKAMYDLNPDADPLEVDPHTALQIAQYAAAKDEFEAAKLNLDTAKMAIAETMGEHKKMVNAEGKTVAVQIETKDSIVVDGAAVKKKHPEVFEECHKVRKGYRSLRIYA